MKKICFATATLLAAATLFSCNEKLKIAAPYKDITVIYGLLDISDTAHYIRIQKAFMDENQSAIDMAKNPDSSFYKALTVRIREIGPGGNVLNIIPLTKVDLTKEGYRKDSGAFFNTPNYAYKFLYPLDPANQYMLVVKNDETGDVDSAITPILDNRDANKLGVAEWNFGAQRIGFDKIYQAGGKLFESIYTVNVPEKVGMYQLILRFHWTDSNINTGAAVRKSADYSQFNIVGTNPVITRSFMVSTQNRDIFDFIKGAVGGKPSDPFLYHYFDSCDMLLYVAGTEYKRYNDLNANKGGLTADEIRPLYTNIKGKDVMGLFSTRTFAKKLNIPFAVETMDSLRTNGITGDLHIRFYQ